MVGWKGGAGREGAGGRWEGGRWEIGIEGSGHQASNMDALFKSKIHAKNHATLLKSKILDYDSMSKTLKLKRFDTLIRSILTYGAEVWIGDYNIREETLDTLPFEKIQNRFCKYLLGVHKKMSNLASRLEFGREPVLNYIGSQTCKYYPRLCQLPEDRLLNEVFELDKTLCQAGYKSWYSCIRNFMQRFSTTEQEMQSCDMSEVISTKYLSDMNKELSRLKNHVQDNKLNTFSSIYIHFFFFAKLSIIWAFKK